MILYYTISSNNFSHITNMSILSYIKTCKELSPVFVLSPHEITNKLTNKNVYYFNMEKYIDNTLFDCGIHNVCKWLKTQIYNIVDLTKYDKIIFSDSDILYFKNITDIIKNIDDNYMYFSWDGHKDKKLKLNKINTGFICLCPTKYQIYDEWSNSVLNRIIFKPKLLDQPCLQKIITDKYFENFKLFDYNFVTQIEKYKHKSYAFHYVFKKYNEMEEDFNNIIKNSF